MSNIEKIAIPPKGTFNKGLSSPSAKFMEAKFGKPGELTEKCSQPNAAFKKHIKFNFDVGPFKIDGHEFAVESLKQIFAEVKEKLPDVFAEVKSDGLLCIRHKRKNKDSFSNHSWGCAIDLFFGDSEKDEVPQGDHLTQRGVLKLVPFFNAHGWMWGGGFSGEFVDSMHFEIAKETVEKIS